MAETTHRLRSSVDGVAWPAVPTRHGAALMSLLFQLEASQWWTAERLLDHQLRQLTVLLAHAYATVPFYRQRLDAAGFRPGTQLTPEQWRGFPVLTRAEIQTAGDTLASRNVPRECGATIETQTSGSTGQPVKVRGTRLDELIWHAMTLRDHLWHAASFEGKLAVIRANTAGAGKPPHGTIQADWGPPVSRLYHTGPAAVLNLSTDIETQFEWLLHHDPEMLLTYPTNLAALIARFAARGRRLTKLRAVRTVGETVTPALRAACSAEWKVPLIDSYSSQEIGYMAMQCPDGGQYHVTAESALVEILADDGKPCLPGEVGRVVVTSLHNFAMPLVRYELRDYAEAGAPCRCGRGLPTIARIIGRSRNLVTLPSGERHWPLVGFDRFREIAPIRQYQFIQHTREEIEVKFVADRALTAGEEARLTGVIQAALGYPFRLAYTYLEGEIPRSAGGKFEEFVSRLV